MRTLLVLRHAKSSLEYPKLSDHDRPLNKRGQSDAPRIGRLLRQQRLSPGAIISSTAKRARQTAEEVVLGSTFDGAIQFEPRLYLGDPATILDVVRRANPDTSRVMIVAHNPGLEELIRRLADEDESLPTAGLAQLRLPIDTWKDLRVSTRGQLVSLWRPKELKDGD